MLPISRKAIIVALGLLLAACGSAPTPTAQPTAEPTAVPTQSAFNNSAIPFEGVVQIWAMFYDEVGELQIGWTGSGTIISPDGLILTNAHVVLPDRYFPVDALVVAMTVGQDQEPVPSYYAETLQADATLDIAVIRVTEDYDGNAVDRASLTLPFVPLGDSDELNLGDGITIIGYPGIGGDTVTLTRGEVSGFTSQPEYGQRAFIKTSATIAGGNSGGLAVDAAGQLIGIPTQLGYGGDDQYVDCRVLADTNRDGFVDDSDSCVPTGGFINALRPVALAVPLIEAAARGEVSIIGGEEPQTADVPASSGTYTDDFSDPNSGWDVVSLDTYASFYQNGEYFIQAVGGGQFFVAEPYLNFDNLEMTIEFRFDQSDDPNAINEIDFVCRYLDAQNYYEFRIMSDGSVGISKWLGAEYILLVTPFSSGAVLGDSMHQAQITCDGNYLGLSLDGETIVEAFDDSFVSGDVGVSAYNPNEGTTFVAAFDNFSVTVPGEQQASEGEVVISDDFSNVNSGWAELSESDYANYYANGEYVMAITPNNYQSWGWLTSDLENIVVNVDVNIQQAAQDGEIGIVCRLVDGNNFYALEVSEDGYFSIWKKVNGEQVALLDWQQSDLIPTDGSPFVVNAACDGAQLQVGINGELLGTVTDSDFAHGAVGLVIGTWGNGNLTVAFDNFEVIEY